MNKRFPLYVMLCLLMVATIGSCNKNNSKTASDDNYYSASASSTLISAFKLGKNNSVLYNIDSVFFTIDQNRKMIYNADSLPKGTKVSKLTVDVTFPTAVGGVKLHVTGGKVMKDTTFDYTSSTTDSIDFTGKVELIVTSVDKKHTCTYDVKVNVHQADPDLLAWDMLNKRNLPNVSGNIADAKVVRQNELFLCLINDNSGYVLSATTNPGQETWTKAMLNFPFTPVVATFTATSKALYLLDTTGELWTSTDNGGNWTDCGIAWHSIIGAYGDKLLGVLNDGEYRHDEYPRMAGYVPTKVADAFPVSGTSPLVQASNTWTVQQQSMIVGGFTKAGSLTNSVWGYDGNAWGRIDNGASTLPAVQEPVLIPYYTFSTDTVKRRTTKQVAWLLMGGKANDGKMNSTTYVSYNQGISWKTAGKTLQLPTYVPAFYGTQTFVVNETRNKAPRRISQPVTSWDCPYIYLAAGKNVEGAVLNSIWKGAIFRLQFKPIY